MAHLQGCVYTFIMGHRQGPWTGDRWPQLSAQHPKNSLNNFALLFLFLPVPSDQPA